MEFPRLIADEHRSTRIQLLHDVLARFGHARIRVWGTSMLPSIWPGATVSIRRVGAEELAPGDVALFTRNGRLFCHRVQTVVSSEGVLSLRTRGDFLRDHDPWVSAAQVLGRVELPAMPASIAFLAPVLRTLSPVLQRPLGWVTRKVPPL